MKARITAAFMATLCASCATSTVPAATSFQLLPGDLLFQDMDAGPLCDAIETVTRGVDGAKFSHVGMVSRVQGDRSFVIEAIGAGVVETSLSVFLDRSRDETGKPKVLVGRVSGMDAALIPRAIDVARSFAGRPYDSVFAMDDSAFYCSELLYESFRIANAGKPVFDLTPMTFIDPSTLATFPAWVSYYRGLGVPVPEGEPGLNPGGMSRAPFVHIVHAYGRPAGWMAPAP